MKPLTFKIFFVMPYLLFGATLFGLGPFYPRISDLIEWAFGWDMLEPDKIHIARTWVAAWFGCLAWLILGGLALWFISHEAGKDEVGLGLVDWEYDHLKKVEKQQRKRDNR